MAITVWCPHPGCGQEFDVRDAARGLGVPCPACHRPVPIAAPAEPPPLTDSAPPRQPLAPPPRPATRSRRRRFGGVRRAFGGRRGASSRFGGEEPKSRHGCVTVWLVIVIATNSLGAVGAILARPLFAGRFPPEISWILPAATAIGIATVICAVGLLNWKLWGFIGMCVLTGVGMSLSLYVGQPPLLVAAGVIQPAFLYALLRMGGRKSTWSQLD